MLIKIEISGLIVGVIAVILDLYIILNSQYLPSFYMELFRGGNTGGVVVGVAILLGIISMLVFIVNMLVGNRAVWTIRLGLLATFVITFSVLGSYL